MKYGFEYFYLWMIPIFVFSFTIFYTNILFLRQGYRFVYCSENELHILILIHDVNKISDAHTCFRFILTILSYRNTIFIL